MNLKKKRRKISYLGASMERVSAREIQTTVFRTEANTNTHINWNLHALIQWEVGTMGNGNFKKFTTYYYDFLK